ncbi:MAG: hypothetical protein HQ567_25670, partial [Candidatus Nealsonbacteria bacterium]|nr:hypothetical protein [Candidatus Nealsonbacteria bacterium]
GRGGGKGRAMAGGAAVAVVGDKVRLPAEATARVLGQVTGEGPGRDKASATVVASAARRGSLIEMQTVSAIISMKY